MRKLGWVVLFLAFAVTNASAGLVARIDVSKQIMTVSENGAVLYHWKVSTARKGYRTPRGTYRPTRLHKMWYSRKYDMSPMPHSIFFYGGYAIHGYTSIPTYPASHGCARTYNGNQDFIYPKVSIGDRVATY